MVSSAKHVIHGTCVTMWVSALPASPKLAQVWHFWAPAWTSSKPWRRVTRKPLTLPICNGSLFRAQDSWLFPLHGQCACCQWTNSGNCSQTFWTEESIIRFNFYPLDVGLGNVVGLPVIPWKDLCEIFSIYNWRPLFAQSGDACRREWWIHNWLFLLQSHCSACFWSGFSRPYLQLVG